MSDEFEAYKDGVSYLISEENYNQFIKGNFNY